MYGPKKLEGMQMEKRNHGFKKRKKAKKTLSPKALKPTEVASLLKKARKNGRNSKAARKRLILPFLNDVVLSASPLATNRDQLIRLIEKGNRALIKSIGQFRGRSSEFSKYVKSRIQKAMRNKSFPRKKLRRLPDK